MEGRLTPLNALLGLLISGDVNRAALADAGFKLVGLEVPVAGRQGTVTVDAVLLHEESVHLLLCEAKSGANVEPGQARRYGSISAEDVVQAGHVTLPRRGALTIETAYVCLADHLERVRVGLQDADLRCPILVVHESSIHLEESAVASDQLIGAFASGPVPLAGPSTRLLPFDHESPVEVLEPFVKAELVAALANRVPHLTITGLAERVSPYLGLFGRKARNQLVRRVGEAVRGLAAADPATFSFEPPAPNRDGLVRLLRTPEDNDPRGRTQAYQALARTGQVRRRAATADPNQLDLLEVLDQADDVSDEEEDEGADGKETP